MPRSPPRRISRFIVMAMLQAARASRLGLPEESAHSWGLNRSIFYAAAKRGFRGGGGGTPSGEAARKDGVPRPPRSEETYLLGDELAYRDPKSPKLLFTIGGEDQTEADFQRQIAARFGNAENFHRAWAESLRIVDQFDAETLRSGRQFYASVYKPRRDELVEEWTERYVPTAPGP